MSSSNPRPANRGFRSVLRCAITDYRQVPSLSAPEPSCDKMTYPDNIKDLVENHLDTQGWILCECKSRGDIEKGFDVQEKDEP